jgi:ABC-type nitrate/sulfonate/bicarbonate transport system substrate-binding protein
MTLHRRQILAGSAGLAASALLPGCSAGDSSRLRVVMTQGISGLAIHELAKQQGFYTKFGVETEVLQVSDGAKCVAALLSGAADICAKSGFNQLTPAIERGAELTILAGALNLASLVMFTAQPGITSIADLTGKSLGIGAPGSVVHQMTVLLLKKSGVDPESVTFRNVGSNADIFKAVVSKTIDAGLSDVEAMDQIARFDVRALPDGKLWERIPDYTNQASYASRKAMATKRDQMVRVLAAWASAYRLASSPGSKTAYLKAHAAAVGESQPGKAATLWTWIQENQPYATNLVLSDERIELVQQVNVDFGVQKVVLPARDIADMSLAREAVGLLG